MSGVSPRYWNVKGLPASLPGVIEPASKLHRPAAGTGLRFTEWLVLIAMGVAYFESIAYPLFGLGLTQTILKHVPLILLAPAFVLHFIGAVFNRQRPVWRSVVMACWPMVALSLFVMGGSSYAKFALGEPSTFLAFGIYLILLPVYAAITRDGKRSESWATALLWLWVSTSVIAFIGMVADLQRVESLHELEYFVVAGFFFWYYATRHAAIKLLAVVLIIATAILNHKLTGYLCGGLAIGHFVVMGGWDRLTPKWRGLYGAGMVVTGLVAAAAVAIAFLAFRQYLPSGNADVRLAQYAHAMDQFYESPIWGAAYLLNSGEDFKEGGYLLNIPTHSDVLDLLKHGGLIAFGLFAFGYWKILRVLNAAIAATGDGRLMNAYFKAARYFLLAALMSFAVNPLLLKGPFLVLIWGNLGLAIGMALFASDRFAQRGK